MSKRQEQLKSYKVKTLLFVNSIRKAFGINKLRTLPKGKPASAFDCVLARCFDRKDAKNHVGVASGVIFDNPTKGYVAARAVRQQMSIDNPTSRIALPKAVSEFVTAFDSREYPELVR